MLPTTALFLPVIPYSVSIAGTLNIPYDRCWNTRKPLPYSDRELRVHDPENSIPSIQRVRVTGTISGTIAKIVPN